MVPLTGEFTTGKAIAEPTDVSRGVAKGKPDDFGVSIGKGTFCGFPDNVGDFRGFVEDQEQALAFVVEACERRRVLFRPWNHVDAPSALSVGVLGE